MDVAKTQLSPLYTQSLPSSPRLCHMEYADYSHKIVLGFRVKKNTAYFFSLSHSSGSSGLLSAITTFLPPPCLFSHFQMLWCTGLSDSACVHVWCYLLDCRCSVYCNFKGRDQERTLMPPSSWHDSKSSLIRLTAILSSETMQAKR